MAHLGRYEILEQVGAGSMGNVYRARDTALDREVALKTIRTGADVELEVRQRFYREARACGRLQHPNIITVFDLGELENTAYIAMEFLEGADVRRIIAERRSMTVEAKIEAAAEVCDAIAYAHSHGVVHRDIKPSNLFLTDLGRVKVLDFGIARLPSSQLTVAGQILGTPNYMAPEQILAKPCDGRADLFSAAVVFFEFLTYAHPFQSNLIPRRIVQSEPDSLFDYDPTLPLILEKVLTRGLAKDPDQRYQTGDAFAADLRTVLEALRGNASPTFSKVQLPSDRVPPSEPIPAVSSSNAQVPDGQDPQEWRLSEALRLLPEFEAAVERGDRANAQITIAQLESRLEGDIRFTEAIRLCRTRLRELMTSSFSTSTKTGPVGQPNVSVIPRPNTEPIATPHAANAAVAGNIDLDVTVFGPPSFKPPPDSAPPPPPTPPRAIPPPASNPPSAKDGPAPFRNLGRNQLTIIAAGVLVCLLSLLLVGIAVFKSVPVQPAVATAVVGASSTNLFDAPEAAAKRFASLASGTRLNILRLPTSRDQEWVSVQAVKPKVLRPGYVQVAALRDWQGGTGASSLAVIRALGLGEAGTDEEIAAQINDLNRLASRFAGDPAAREARLDIVRLRLALAQRHQGKGLPLQDWQSEIQAAQQDLSAAGGDNNLQARLQEMTQPPPEVAPSKDTQTLSRTQATTLPVPAPPQPEVNIADLLAKAKQLREDGDYTGAERELKRILRADPSNAEANELLKRIKKSRDAE